MGQVKRKDYDEIIKDLETMKIKDIASKRKCSVGTIYHVRNCERDFAPQRNKTIQRRIDTSGFQPILKGEIEAFLRARKNFTAWIIGAEDK